MKKQLDESLDALLMNSSYAQDRRFELLNKARERWKESEWLLGMLRSRSAVEPKQPDDDALVEWHQRTTSAPFCQ